MEWDHACWSCGTLEEEGKRPLGRKPSECVPLLRWWHGGGRPSRAVRLHCHCTVTVCVDPMPRGMTALCTRAGESKKLLLGEEVTATEIVSVVLLHCLYGNTSLAQHTPRVPSLPRTLGSAEVKPSCTLHAHKELRLGTSAESWAFVLL